MYKLLPQGNNEISTKEKRNTYPPLFIRPTSLCASGPDFLFTVKRLPFAWGEKPISGPRTVWHTGFQPLTLAVYLALVPFSAVRWHRKIKALRNSRYHCFPVCQCLSCMFLNVCKHNFVNRPHLHGVWRTAHFPKLMVLGKAVESLV